MPQDSDWEASQKPVPMDTDTAANTMTSAVRQSQRRTRSSYVSLHPLPPLPERDTLGANYVSLLEGGAKYFVLGLFLVSSCVSVNWALKLFSKTKMEWNAPSGSWAEEQREVANHFYADAVGGTDFIVNIEWKDPERAKNIVDVNPSFESMGLPNYLYPNELMPVTRAGTAEFTEVLHEKIWEDICLFPATYTRQLISQGIPPMCSMGAAGIQWISLFSGYWAVYDYDPIASLTYVASTRQNRSTFIVITLQGENVGLPDRSDEFSDKLQAWVDELAPVFLTPVEMTASVLSIKGAQKEILGTVESDLALADGIAIPMSLLVAMLALRNVRLMLVPLALTLGTTFISMAVVEGMAEHMSVSVVCPLIMVSLVVALPVGNCLFLLNRFREAILEGEGCSVAVSRMLATAGKTVLLSQVCIMVCCILISLVNVDTVRAMGLSMLASVGISALGSMTLVPALLLTFPNFFEKVDTHTTGFGGKRETVALASQLKGKVKTYDAIAEDDESVVLHAAPELRGTKWHRFAHSTQESSLMFAAFVFVLLVAAVAPFAIVLFKNTEYGDSFKVLLPRNDDYTHTVERIFANYGEGLITPLVVVAVPPSESKMQVEWAEALGVNPEEPVFVLNGTNGTANNYLWDDLSNFMDTLQGSPGFSPEGCVGSWYFRGIQFNGISQALASRWITESIAASKAIDQFKNPETGEDYWPSLSWRAAALRLTSNTRAGVEIAGQFPELLNVSFANASYTRVVLGVDPLGAKGHEFMDRFRSLAGYYNERGLARIYVAGTGVNSAAVIDKLNTAWRWLVPSFFATALVVVLLGTGSLMIALRTALTTFATVCFAMGFTSFVFCHNALGWTGIDALQQFSTGELHYFAPVVTVPLLIGFCVSHEVFVMSASLMWYHHHHLSSREATKFGLIGVGWMNILSGVILAIAFVGHIFARLPLANQTAFGVVVGVLFDVFIIRTLVVPVLMAPFGSANWWPASEREAVIDRADARQARPNPLESMPKEP